MLPQQGTGTFQNHYRPGVYGLTAGGVDYAARIAAIERARQEYYKQLGIPPGIPTMKGHYGEAEYTGDAISLDSLDLSDTGTPTGWPKKPIFAPPGGPPGPPIQWGDDITNDNADLGFGYIGGGLEEQDSYFYHSDHLGSTSYLTDLKGNVRQYTAYMPYGESFVSEHTTSTELPYLFNGKPLDEETGLYYYGARYYEPKEGMMLNIDRFAEKYPNVGGYSYCIGNPIKYVDVRGDSLEISSRDRSHFRSALESAFAEKASQFNYNSSNKLQFNGDIKNLVQT